MNWQFNVYDGTNNFIFRAEIIYANYQIEEIKISGEGISIILQSNRPLLEAIELKRPINWKIIKGKINDNEILERITKGLEKSLNSQKISED